MSLIVILHVLLQQSSEQWVNKPDLKWRLSTPAVDQDAQQQVCQVENQWECPLRELAILAEPIPLQENAHWLG